MKVIRIPRVASRAIENALNRSEVHYDYTIAWIRHPFDRIISALYGPLRSEVPLDERLEFFWQFKSIEQHIRPQVSFLPNSLRVLTPGQCTDNGALRPFETINEDWQALPMAPLILQGKTEDRPRWQDADIDWSRWESRYAEDLECHEKLLSSVEPLKPGRKYRPLSQDAAMTNSMLGRHDTIGRQGIVLM